MFDGRLPFTNHCDSMFIPHSPLKLIFGDAYSSKNFAYLMQLYCYRNMYGQEIFRHVIGSSAPRHHGSLFICNPNYGFEQYYSSGVGILPIAIGLFKYRDLSEVKFEILNTVTRVTAYHKDIVFLDLARSNENWPEYRVSVQPMLGYSVIFDAPTNLFDYGDCIDISSCLAIDYALDIHKRKEFVKNLFYCSFTIDGSAVEVRFSIHYQRSAPVFATHLVFSEELYRVYGDWPWDIEFCDPVNTPLCFLDYIEFGELGTVNHFYCKVFSFVLGKEYCIQVRGSRLDNFIDMLLHNSEKLCKRVHNKFRRVMVKRGVEVGPFKVMRCE